MTTDISRGAGRAPEARGGDVPPGLCPHGVQTGPGLAPCPICRASTAPRASRTAILRNWVLLVVVLAAIAALAIWWT